MADNNDDPMLSDTGDLNDSGAEGEDDEGGPAMSMNEAVKFQGYGNAAPFGSPFQGVPAPPAAAMPTGQRPVMEYGNAENLDESACREALLDFAASQCCYGKGAAKKHEIKCTKPFTSFHYVLETFKEGRKTGNKYVSFQGQPIDGPQNGNPPLPWQIHCEPNEMFKNHTKLIEVPHTAYVKQCHRCNGCGRVTCGRCSGRGRVRCGRCHGRGKKRHYSSKDKKWVSRTCGSCGGRGKKTCIRCHGCGKVTCRICEGTGQLKCYIELEVTFTNYFQDHIYEPTDMPDELIADATGDLIFEQQLFQVWPVKDFPIQDIATNSVKMVEEHRTRWPNERQLNQRQHIRSVPVTEVDAVWKDWNSRYWVYGYDRRVYSPDYPQTCCWGCNIL